tara:strand:- start:73 stop:528 length:456 start_codon:yes stop_codon:yes gene_type:complete
MNKKIILIFSLSFLIFSCSNNDKIGIDRNVKTDLLDNAKADISKNNQQINSQYALLSESTDFNSVTADQLKVDGQQRYFLNDTLYTGFTNQFIGDQIIFEIKFNNGRKDGVSKFWYKNGNPKSMLTFKNGIVQGAYKLWDQSGNLIDQGTN